MFQKHSAIFTLFLGLLALVTGDFYEECGDDEQTYVAVQEDCSFYIFCHGEESYKDSCPEDSPYFSIEEQVCDTDRNVCDDRPFPEGDFDSEKVEIEELETPTTNSNTNQTTTIPSNTTLAPVTRTTPTTPTTSIINTTISPTTLALQTPSTPFIPFVIPSSCPAVDNPNKAVFLAHPKSCSEYFVCYRGERMAMHCSHMLHFDVRQQKCDYPEKVKCFMMDIVTPREQCLPHTFDVYPHPRNCNYYYQCLKGYLKVMQCPLNMGWDYERRACVLRAQAKCYSSSGLRI